MEMRSGRKDLRVTRDVGQAPAGRDSGEAVAVALRRSSAPLAGWGEEWWLSPRPESRRRLEAPAHWLALAEAP